MSPFPEHASPDPGSADAAAGFSRSYVAGGTLWRTEGNSFRATLADGREALVFRLRTGGFWWKAGMETGPSLHTGLFATLRWLARDARIRVEQDRRQAVIAFPARHAAQ